MNNRTQDKLPAGWREVRLGEVVSYIDDKIITSNINLNNYISTDNMLSNLGGVAQVDKLPSVNKVKRFKKEDILFSNIRTYFRKVWFSNMYGGCSNDILVFRPEGDKLYSKYLYYILADNKFIDYSNTTSKGTKMPRGDKSAIMQYLFSIPPLPEQKAIAHILGSLDDKIELNRHLNHTLEEMAQALFKSWFVDFDPVIDNALIAGNLIPAPLQKRAANRKQALQYGSANRELARHFPAAFVYHNKMGYIPQGWEVKTIGDCLEPKRGKTITKKQTVAGNIPVVAGGLEPAYYHNTSNINAPVITISASGANAGFVNIYFQDIWASDCSYISKKETDYIYTFYTMLKHRQSDIYFMQQGAAQPHIYPKDIMRILYLIPPKDIFEIHENSIAIMYSRIMKNKIQNQTLTQLRDTLLPKLISGKIRIADADNIITELHA